MLFKHNIDLFNNQLLRARLQNITTAARNALVLTAANAGYCVYDTTLNLPFFWNGSVWQGFGNTARQTITTGAVNFALGGLVTMNLQASVANITLALTNPSENTFVITVIDHATTARAITFPANTRFASDINIVDFTVGGLVLTPAVANTRYKIQLEYHSSDPIIGGIHYEVTAFRIA